MTNPTMAVQRRLPLLDADSRSRSGPAGYPATMVVVRLRPVRSDDIPLLCGSDPNADPFGFYGFTPTNALERAFAANGLISDDNGTLAVEDENGTVAGTVGWFAVRHGPASTARALNIGIALLPQQRGRGLGTAAQEALAAYLFDNTLIERLEAGTDTDNIAEQRALEKAGFQREGVARHAQYRAGRWRDLVLYSRLRGDHGHAS
jgi:RimJ/RimL family protein N-acetyltransferase